MTKEPRCRQVGRRNVGIMRYLLVGSAPFQVFVTDLDTDRWLVREGGDLLAPTPAPGPPALDPRQLTSPDVSRGDARESGIPRGAEGSVCRLHAAWT